MARCQGLRLQEVTSICFYTMHWWFAMDACCQGAGERMGYHPSTPEDYETLATYVRTVMHYRTSVVVVHMYRMAVILFILEAQ